MRHPREASRDELVEQANEWMIDFDENEDDLLSASELELLLRFINGHDKHGNEKEWKEVYDAPLADGDKPRSIDAEAEMDKQPEPLKIMTSNDFDGDAQLSKDELVNLLMRMKRHDRQAEQQEELKREQEAGKRNSDILDTLTDAFARSGIRPHTDLIESRKKRDDKVRSLYERRVKRRKKKARRGEARVKDEM
eukprot:CAMPEP_0119335908 /NCGR_PEP_ID=MMETSP1333-20130426/90646_1 /TAXON_ID=418940 /ORGANISM="Scyphosphaera apsteinii, Strain RCC1455" /LENGTH=193 /DNA_ID=CAMNT_0007346581 /DNA_START=110 /DNA_END=691 /DNA_ORIENTATION=-